MDDPSIRGLQTESYLQAFCGVAILHYCRQNHGSDGLSDALCADLQAAQPPQRMHTPRRLSAGQAAASDPLLKH